MQRVADALSGLCACVFARAWCEKQVGMEAIVGPGAFLTTETGAEPGAKTDTP